MNGTLRRRVAGLAVLGLWLAAAGAATAAEPDVTFKKRGTEEKRFVESVGKAIIKAAHSTGKKPALLEYKYEKPKEGRTNLKMKMEFYGAATKKRYIADIVVKIDSSNKEAWEVLNIEYSDNDSIPYSIKKVQALIKQFNK